MFFLKVQLVIKHFISRRATRHVFFFSLLVPETDQKREIFASVPLTATSDLWALHSPPLVSFLLCFAVYHTVQLLVVLDTKSSLANPLLPPECSSSLRLLVCVLEQQRVT